MMTSSKDSVKQQQPAKSAGQRSGRMMREKITQSLAPKSFGFKNFYRNSHQAAVNGNDDKRNAKARAIATSR
jgi:hypothetical protein